MPGMLCHVSSWAVGCSAKGAAGSNTAHASMPAALSTSSKVSLTSVEQPCVPASPAASLVALALEGSVVAHKPGLLALLARLGAQGTARKAFGGEEGASIAARLWLRVIII